MRFNVLSAARFLIGLFLIGLFLAETSRAAVTVPSMFGDAMVLQRDAAVPIWGSAKPDEVVTVTFAGQTAQATADAQGAWRLTLKPLTASAQPRTLEVRGSAQDGAPLVIKNCLVGDVWVGSGQSNMAGRVSGYARNDHELAKLLKHGTFPAIRLMQGGPKPQWQETSPETVGRFSALLFAFGQRLQRETKVPIGLIVGAVGGTPSGYWIPADAYENSPECRAAVAKFSKTWNRQNAQAQYEKQLAAWQARVADAKAKGKKARGRKPQPPKEPGQSIRGGAIGGLYARYIQSVAGYRIRGVLWDQGEAGSGVLGVDQHTLMSALIRSWRSEWKQNDLPFLFVQKPSGGGCAFRSDDPITQKADPFVAPLPDVRSMGSGDQRYLYVRLMRDNPNSWMVPVSDLGSGIHPTNKWGYGNRAAEVALSQVYRTGIQAYGPLYRSHRIDGNKLVIQFDHAGKGLTAAHNSQLQGFALADSQGGWKWANARIEGSTVVVWSDEIVKPTRVRYAYAARRQWANLFNLDGRPAIAFEAGN